MSWAFPTTSYTPLASTSESQASSSSAAPMVSSPARGVSGGVGDDGMRGFYYDGSTIPPDDITIFLNSLYDVPTPGDSEGPSMRHSVPSSVLPHISPYNVTGQWETQSAAFNPMFAATGAFDSRDVTRPLAPAAPQAPSFPVQAAMEAMIPPREIRSPSMSAFNGREYRQVRRYVPYQHPQSPRSSLSRESAPAPAPTPAVNSDILGFVPPTFDAVYERSAPPAKKRTFCQCGRSYAREQELKRHIAAAHWEFPVPPWSCCGVPLAKADEYNVPAHVLAGPRTPYEGTVMVGGCGEGFKRKEFYSRHLKKCAGVCFGDTNAVYLPGNWL